MQEFRGFVAIRESFLNEIWGRGVLGAAKASNLQKFSLRKSYFSPICKSFLPRKLLWGLIPIPSGVLQSSLGMRPGYAVGSCQCSLTSLHLLCPDGGVDAV